MKFIEYTNGTASCENVAGNFTNLPKCNTGKCIVLKNKQFSCENETVPGLIYGTNPNKCIKTIS